MVPMNDDKVFRDVALLIARLVIGGSIAAHGAQKLFGAFGGPGPEKAGEMFSNLRFPNGAAYARTASSTELTAGMLIAAGALGPTGPAMLLAVMAVAVETVHRRNGYFAQNGGYELNTMYALTALLLATHGPGGFSVDGRLGLEPRLRAWHGWLAVLGAAAGAAAILAQREPPAPPSARVERGDTQVSQPSDATTSR